MRILFLDVDGVLNSASDYYSYELNNEVHFMLLRYIIENTGAKIVLSSAWRIGLNSPHTRSHYLLDKLEKYGLTIYDKTPVLMYPNKRGDEIRSWLNNCKEDIESFAILDDESDMCEFSETNFIPTDTRIGLTKEDAEKCIDLLLGVQ